ncbi:regulatory helix-turn-helix protein, lysR family [Mucilaginibacter sp. OK098]|nr:regulatory helix-turn-helix protein, lysR family [Mucilaginibacter sp. OK098]
MFNLSIITQILKYCLYSQNVIFYENNRKNRFRNMELRQLKYFLKAKELLNFTEAARALNISQSTLSQQIKQLEDELNVPAVRSF